MKWYKEFFENWYLDFYLPLPKFKHSYIKKEVSFIDNVLKLPKGAKILDLCCGHGRHLIPLAKKGYDMTGLDLSEKALNLLRKNAKKEKIKARLIRGDMRKIPFSNEFDAIINMFTAFGYLETDYEDFKVLKQVSKALKPKGKFIIDIKNSDWLLANLEEKSWQKQGKLLLLEERKYDKKKKRLTLKTEILDEKGKWHKSSNVLRIYSLGEMRNNLNKVGLKVIKTYGDPFTGEKFTKNCKRLTILAYKK